MSFYLFRRYFLSSRSGSLIRIVSWICLAGMSISVAALIIIISVMGGFGKAIKSRLLAKEAHLVIHFEKNPFLTKKNPLLKQKLITKNPTAQSHKKSLFFDTNDKDKLPLIFSSLTQKQKDGIKEVLIFETQDLILKSPNGFQGISAIAYSENQWDKKVLQTSSFLETNLQNQFTIPLAPSEDKEVLLSYELSLKTGLYPGDELTLIPLAGLLLPPSLLPPTKRLKVKGILQDTQQGKENLLIYYKQGLIDFGDFSQIKYGANIQLHNPEQLSIYQNLFKEYKIQTWIERNSTLFFALKLRKVFNDFISCSFFIDLLFGNFLCSLFTHNSKSKRFGYISCYGFIAKRNH